MTSLSSSAKYLSPMTTASTISRMRAPSFETGLARDAARNATSKDVATLTMRSDANYKSIGDIGALRTRMSRFTTPSLRSPRSHYLVCTGPSSMLSTRGV